MTLGPVRCGAGVPRWVARSSSISSAQRGKPPGYRAYLARGLSARRPDRVLGLALLRPVAEHSRNVPERHVVRQDTGAYDDLEPAQRAGFDEYFVLRTPATARRYRD